MIEEHTSGMGDDIEAEEVEADADFVVRTEWRRNCMTAMWMMRDATAHMHIVNTVWKSSEA